MKSSHSLCLSSEPWVVASKETLVMSSTNKGVIGESPLTCPALTRCHESHRNKRCIFCPWWGTLLYSIRENYNKGILDVFINDKNDSTSQDIHYQMVGNQLKVISGNKDERHGWELLRGIRSHTRSYGQTSSEYHRWDIIQYDTIQVAVFWSQADQGSKPNSSTHSLCLQPWLNYLTSLLSPRFLI